MTRDETIEGLQEIIDRNKNTLLPRVHIGYLIHAVKYLKIVRCKDCIYCDKERTDKNMIWCNLHLFARPESHYCADGNNNRGDQI